MLMALDVGERRIGVALADLGVKIAVPKGVVEVDGTEIDAICELVRENAVKELVIGLPRGSDGGLTKQSEYVQGFVARLPDMGIKVVYQDESLTSVKAEEYLGASKKPYSKGDVDARAAAIILQDYLEEVSR